MIITVTYTSESNKETAALRMSALTMQNAGMNVVFIEPGPDGTEAKVMMSESRRSRKGKTETA